MIKWFQKKLADRQEIKDKSDKARLCEPCKDPCGKELCRRVGCLNMDMRTNSLRLKLLVNRVDAAHDKIQNQKMVVNSVYGKFIHKAPKPKSTVVNLNDYRK